MGDAKVNVNDIKPIESFSVEGCYYFKTEDGEVHRTCLEKLSQRWDEIDETFAKGGDPKKAAKAKKKWAKKIAAMESNSEDALNKYREVVAVQEGIISIFKSNYQFANECSSKVEEDEGDYTVFIPDPRASGLLSCTSDMVSSFEIEFEDIDEDGLADKIDIDQKNMNETSFSHGYMTGGCGLCFPFWPSDYLAGYVEYNKDHRYLLAGKSFEPLISSLLKFFVDA